MAFGCTFEPGGEEFFEWLMRNGYPELGALSNTIQGDHEAKDWLRKRKPKNGSPKTILRSTSPSQKPLIETMKPENGSKKTSYRFSSSSPIRFANIWMTNI